MLVPNIDLQNKAILVTGADLGCPNFGDTLKNKKVLDIFGCVW